MALSLTAVAAVVVIALLLLVFEAIKNFELINIIYSIYNLLKKHQPLGLDLRAIYKFR